MLFQFHDFNHCPQGKIAIADIIAIMGHQLIALGHEVGWPSDGPMNFISLDRGYNVLLEAFTDDGTIETIAAAHEGGCAFVYVATEEPSPLGFNMGNAYGMIERQKVFPIAACYCDAILHLVPGSATTAWYSQFAPAAYAELGYAPGLVYHEPAGAPEPEYDFGFYGQTTPRREEIFAKLRGYGTLLTEYRLMLPRAERDALMRRARVIVTVRAQDNVEYVSSTRCATALFLGRPVIAEPHDIKLAWDQVVHFASDYEPFYDDAARAAHGDWRVLREQQLAKMAYALPPEYCLGRALKEVGLQR